MYICTYIHLYYIHIYIYTHAYIRLYINTHIHLYIYAYIHIHIYIYIHYGFVSAITVSCCGRQLPRLPREKEARVALAALMFFQLRKAFTRFHPPRRKPGQVHVHAYANVHTYVYTQVTI